MENTKKTVNKNNILRLFGEGSIDKIKKHLRKPKLTKKKYNNSKKSKKNKKIKTIDPMGHSVTRVQT